MFLHHKRIEAGKWRFRTQYLSIFCRSWEFWPGTVNVNSVAVMSMAFFVLENCCLRLLVSAGTKQSGGDGSPELPAAGSRRGGVVTGWTLRTQKSEDGNQTTRTHYIGHIYSYGWWSMNWIPSLCLNRWMYLQEVGGRPARRLTWVAGSKVAGPACRSWGRSRLFQTLGMPIFPPFDCPDLGVLLIL